MLPNVLEIRPDCDSDLIHYQAAFKYFYRVQWNLSTSSFSSFSITISSFNLILFRQVDFFIISTLSSKQTFFVVLCLLSGACVPCFLYTGWANCDLAFVNFDPLTLKLSLFVLFFLFAGHNLISWLLFGSQNKPACFCRMFIDEGYN